MTQLSWQPPPVTKCDECRSSIGDKCRFLFYDSEQRREFLHEHNKNGITPTCPAWQQQNKDKL